MMPVYVSFSNWVLNTGIIPYFWLDGIMEPIYKRKGVLLQPENYRPVLILTCFGKLFTSILNIRFQTFFRRVSFDSVWRIGLRQKLIGNNINGKLFRIIHNLYKVLSSGEQSNYMHMYFKSFKGVRQGEIVRLSYLHFF